MTSSIEKSIPSCVHECITEEREDGSVEVTAKCLFPKSFVGFEGHFNNNPVLPAIVQLATVRLIVEQTLAKNLSPTHYSKAKFRVMVKPEQEVFFCITIANKGKQIQGKFNIRSLNKEAIAEGKYAFRENL